MATRKQVIELLQKENARLWEENADMKSRIEDAIAELKDYEDSSDRCFCDVISILKGQEHKPAAAPKPGKEEGSE